MAKFNDENDKGSSGASETHESGRYHTTVWAAFTSSAARQEQARFFRDFAVREHGCERFGDADALIAFLRLDDAREYDRYDEIYLALIREQQTAPASGLLSLLVRAMLPALVGVFRARAKNRDEAVDRDDLCSRVLTAFADAIAEYPLEAWPRGVAKNLKLNTITRLRASEARDARDRESFENHAQAAAGFLAEQERSEQSESGGVWDEQMVAEEAPAPPHPDELAELAVCLDGYVREGLLYARDAPLLFQLCGLGRPLADVAAELGITEEAAQKRKERALADIRDKRVRRGRKK